MDRNGSQRLARLLLTLVLPLAWIAAARFLPWADMKDQAKAVFLFLGVFPLINALFDVLSYGVTLALIKFGLQRGTPIRYGVLDLIIAGVLFLGLGAALVLVITGLNRIAGVPILDMGAVFAGLRERPNQYWWIYTMVFSSALPTALHFLVSLIGFQGWMFKFLREPLALRLEAKTPGEGELILLSVWLSLIWFVPFVLAAAAAAGVWWLGAHHAAQWAGGLYYDQLFKLAQWDGSF